MTMHSPTPKARPEALAERVYQALKEEIFAFRLMPGDRFSESEIAGRMAVSRTPVRQALFRLEREGFVEVWFRSGWQIRNFDFAWFESLYDLRTVLECEAVKRLCALPAAQCSALLTGLTRFWCQDERLTAGLTVSQPEMARIHAELTEKIRIIRRLDFTSDDRITATYQEHEQILQAIFQQQTEEAQRILTDHIAVSKAEVRKITLHRLQQARLQPIE